MLIAMNSENNAVARIRGCASADYLKSCKLTPNFYTVRMAALSPKPVIPTYQPLIVVLIAVSCGIVVDRYSPFSVRTWLMLAVICVVIWHRQKAHPTRAAIILLVATAALGGAWHHQHWYEFATNDLGSRALVEPQSVVMEGIVWSKPQRMPAPPPNPMRAIEVGDRSRLDLQVLRIRDGRDWQDVSGSTTVIVQGHLFDLFSGDRVRICGQLAAPSPAQNPGDFDFAEFCRGNRVLSIVRCDSPQSIEVIERGQPWQLSRWIDAIRTAGEHSLWRFISPKNAGLASAMFLGLREELDPEQMDAFKETGTVHLLVISGLNVGILAACMLIGSRMGWLSTRMTMILLVVVTVLYAVVTDAQAPVVRATVLVVVFSCARLIGRQGVAFNTLAAAALVVLLINPVELFRPVTQLSFLAVAALIAIGQAWLTRPTSTVDNLVMQSLPARMQLMYLALTIVWKSVLASFVVWVVVQPLVAARFNLVTPSAIFLGPILSFFVAVAMAMGFVVMVFGWLLPPVGFVCGFICDRMLSIVVSAVEATRDAPGGKFWTSGPSDWWLAGFYGALAAWALIPSVRRIQHRWLITAAIAWCSIGLTTHYWGQISRDSVRGAFLSVGHGLAVVIQLPDGKVVLYDAGSLAAPEVASRAVSNYLFSRGIRTVDLMVISHADADHYNAIPQLLTRFDVREICFTSHMFDDQIEPLQVLRGALAEAVPSVRQIEAGDTLVDDDRVQLKVLQPSADRMSGNDNANSIVLKLTFSGQSLLLTGDLESDGVGLLAARVPEPIDLLLVPHHGSVRSDPQTLAQWATPKYAIASGNFRDRSPAVRIAYEKAGGRFYHTSDSGAVMFEMSAQGCAVTPFCIQQSR